MREAAYEIARQQDGFEDGALQRFARWIVAVVARRVRRQAAVAHLSRLDDYLLKDVGLSRADLEDMAGDTLHRPLRAVEESRWAR